MDRDRLKYLFTCLSYNKEFIELAEYYIKAYSRSNPQSEMETVRKFERIRFLREILDTAEESIKQTGE